MNRRDDIQGLRAVAVIAVVLYHFKVWPFTGGFVGVDIFFVISGYLITGMIVREARMRPFSLAAFYTRRSRRLLPALFATIVLAFVAGAVLFYPYDFARQSEATVFSLLGISNIFFWMEAGYFDSELI